MSTLQYTNSDGFRFRFGRTASDNACVETEDGKRSVFGRYVFGLDQESDLAEFFGERQAAQPDRHEPVDPAIIARAKAEALREFADGVRFPNDWILFRRRDDSGVTVPDLLRETAARYEREAEPEPDPEQVRAWVQWLADNGAGRNGVAETLVRAGLEVPTDG